jgi:glycosyltransferase involved in cell wall biosynthesis
LQICAVIPVFNHERTVGQVVTAVRHADLPCILVDDGSAKACALELDRLSTLDSAVRVVRLTQNQGKGGAVMAGLRAARNLEFSHALQVDADGQHALRDIPKFVQEARNQPLALICGRPVFDVSMPTLRRRGRYLTHVLVWLETLSFAIPDAMCGFRVYPLTPVIKLADRVKLGSRMDFDVEVLVRLYWRKQPMRWLPIAVHYPPDGVSHFQLVRDNLRMVWLHTKLLCGMLWRLPLLLWRKRASEVVQR